jgi:hypothetical protein
VSYVPAIGLVVIGLVILILALFRLARVARRFAAVRAQVNGEVSAATGMLRARSAALRVAVRNRREKKAIGPATEA